MKNVIIFTIVLVFGISTYCFADGITSGASRDTTYRQKQKTRIKMRRARQQKRNNISRDDAYKYLEKSGNRVAPGAGTTSKWLLKAMEWTGREQRQGGGVTGTGNTTKRRR